jgi:hypothetical protein
VSPWVWKNVATSGRLGDQGHWHGGLHRSGTTERYTGCGHVIRKAPREDARGRVHEIEGTGDSWKVLLLIEAVSKMPLAVKVGQIREHEMLGGRALVTQARLNLAVGSRMAKVVFDKGFVNGTTLGWLDQQGIQFVVPAKTNMAVTADDRAQAAAGEEITVGRRAHAVRHGHGKAAWRDRLETEVVGIIGLTTADPCGTPEHGGHANRRTFQASPVNGVVVRQ